MTSSYRVIYKGAHYTPAASCHTPDSITSTFRSPSGIKLGKRDKSRLYVIVNWNNLSANKKPGTFVPGFFTNSRTG